MLTSPELVWLLAAVAKGDEAAFERLYQATRAKLYGGVLRILRRADLADAVMQGSLSRGLEFRRAVRSGIGLPDHLDACDRPQPRD